eukprot:m.169306 g.169306  ORF g.169306 m.169306 type:complete len:250 (-) comp18240_c1_seq1:328-1077(-)
MGTSAKKRPTTPLTKPKTPKGDKLMSEKKAKKTPRKSKKSNEKGKDSGTEDVSSDHDDGKNPTQMEIDEDEDEDAAPMEVSSKSNVLQHADIQEHDPSYVDSSLEARKLRHKKKQRRERLDPAILEAAQVDLEAKAAQEETSETATGDIRSEFKGSRIKFDVNNESEVKISKKRKVRKSRDVRQTSTGLQVRRLEAKPRGAQREVPAAVQDFVQSHFYGDRLRRVAKGAINRQRKSGPAKVFVPGKKLY